MRILLVEDDALLARSLIDRLSSAGYVVDHVASGEAAQAASAAVAYPLAILDRRLPDGDAIGRIGALRRSSPDMRIVVLTALDAVVEKVGGLDAGADDYLTKPVDPDELLARLRAALRRPGAPAQPRITCGRLSYDPGSREFHVAGHALVLKRREWMILETLIMRARRVVQRHEFMNRVYGFDDEVQSNTLDAHISRLRSRLAELQAEVLIHPIRGVGYMLIEMGPPT
jgi:DNA-binding response OmpR family regulator